MIDAHVHLWDRRVLGYPWQDALPPGDRLRKLADPARLLAALPGPLQGVVLVEADAADGLAEARWLAEAAAALPCPFALVAHVPMTARDARARLRAVAALPGVVAIREVATWHPDPAKRRISDPDRLDSAAFRASMAEVARFGLGFELMISSFQAEAGARLARDFPNMRLMLNHCGLPTDHRAEGRALWRDGLQRMAEQPNVAVKLTDPAVHRPDAPRDWLLDVLRLCLDIFGPSRAAYGSDWPIAAMPPVRWASVVREAIEDLHPTAQERVWSGTAKAFYFGGRHAPLPRGAAPDA